MCKFCDRNFIDKNQISLFGWWCLAYNNKPIKKEREWLQLVLFPLRHTSRFDVPIEHWVFGNIDLFYNIKGIKEYSIIINNNNEHLLFDIIPKITKI